MSSVFLLADGTRKEDHYPCRRFSVLFSPAVSSNTSRPNGVALAQTTSQTGNGSEFIGSCGPKEPTGFTRSIEHWKARHWTPPPAAHSRQSAVETVHRLIDCEFCRIESCRDRRAGGVTPGSSRRETASTRLAG